MIRRDYLQRQIDQLGRAMGVMVSKLLGIKSQGKTQEMVEMINQFIKQELELDLSELIRLDDDAFFHFLLKEKGLKDYHLEYLSEMLYNLGQEHELNDQPELATPYYQKALILFEHIENHSPTFDLIRSNKITDLKKAVPYKSQQTERQQVTSIKI